MRLELGVCISGALLVLLLMALHALLWVFFTFQVLGWDA